MQLIVTEHCYKHGCDFSDCVFWRLRLLLKKSDVSDCVKMLLTTFSAFQKSKNLPTAYLSPRRYVRDKFLFSHFFWKKQTKLSNAIWKVIFLKSRSSRQKTQPEKVFSYIFDGVNIQIIIKIFWSLFHSMNCASCFITT